MSAASRPQSTTSSKFALSTWAMAVPKLPAPKTVAFFMGRAL